MPNDYRVFQHVPVFLSITNITSLKFRLRFPSRHQTRLNSGSIPEFNTKGGFDSRIYETKIFRNTKKKLKFGRAVTFILKAEKSENTILFFFPNKKKFLYILLYIEYSRIFFCIFSIFFQGCLQPEPQRWQNIPGGSSSCEVDVMEMKWRMRDDR